MTRREYNNSLENACGAIQRAMDSGLYSTVQNHNLAQALADIRFVLAPPVKMENERPRPKLSVIEKGD